MTTTTAHPLSDPAMALIGEARRRQRRRRGGIAVLVAGVVIAVSVFVVGGRGSGAPTGGNSTPGRAVRTAGSSVSSNSLRPAASIRWLFQHQPRGESLAQAGVPLGTLVGSHWQPVRFARVLRPISTGKYLIALSLIGKRGLNVCVTTFVGRKPLGGGCGADLNLRPFNSTLFSGSDLHRALLSGVAADSVTRIIVRTANGHSIRVAVHDNTFVVRVAKPQFPLRLVAYDAHGHAIGSTSWKTTVPTLH